MTDTAAGRGGSDAESARALVLGLLDRIEHFATTVIGDGDGDGDGRDPASDLGPAIRATVDTFIAEAAELVSKLIAAIIAVLEAISAALDDAVGDRPAHHRPGRPARSGGGFQRIPVDIESAQPQP